MAVRVSSPPPAPGPEAVAAEAERLAGLGLASMGWGERELERAASLTLRINRLKAETGTVIPAHVYQRPEILLGVADFVGDSYKLARQCADSGARRVAFCGVRFMAETAKILSPEAEVLLPAPEAGCSLSESITAADLRALRRRHPGAPAAVYINTSAAVKAEADVVVTSANAPRILRRLFAEHPKVIFAPDRMMGLNLARELGKAPGRELVLWDGTCLVHDNFDEASVAHYRRLYPGVRIMAHFECSPGLASAADFVGGTGDMMREIASRRAPAYMLVTECGLGDLARARFPDRVFVPMCRLCPHMKATTLERLLRCLERPAASQRIELPAAVAERARGPIRRMFELAEDRSAS